MHFNIEFISLNVNGLGDDFKRQSLLLWLKKFNCDIIFLQETHSVVSVENRWKSEWGGDIFFSHGESNKKGVAILVNNKLDYKVNEEIVDENGRYIILNISVDGTDFLLVNFYAPTKNFEAEQVVYIDQLRILLEDQLDQNMILGGDFNTVLNPDIDKKGGSQYNTPLRYTDKLKKLYE